MTECQLINKHNTYYKLEKIESDLLEWYLQMTPEATTREDQEHFFDIITYIVDAKKKFKLTVDEQHRYDYEMG